MSGITTFLRRITAHVPHLVVPDDPITVAKRDRLLTERSNLFDQYDDLRRRQVEAKHAREALESNRAAAGHVARYDDLLGTLANRQRAISTRTCSKPRVMHWSRRP